MREYAKKPESQSRTLDSNSKASKQAPIGVILQRYKERNIQQYIEDEELIQGKFSDTVQREEFDENELLQGKLDTTQQEEIDEEELLQGKFDSTSTTEQEPVQQEEKPNNTGLPDNLKTGIENLSGYSMDDVKVHYNSDKPAQLQALAYTQRTDIHVAPGQEKLLPHEAWHVVQQKQGRVQPTMQLKGVNVNDNEGLEKEADVMGVNCLNTNQSIALIHMDTTNKSDTCQFALSPISWALFIGSALFSHPKRAAWAANNGNDWQHATQLYNILIQFNLGTDNLGWTPANLVNLAGLFGVNAGVCTSQQWGQIAEVHINLINQENDVAEFARIAGWIPANLVILAGLFGANAGVCNAQQWAQIAANMVDQENNVATFARIAGWTPANLVILAGLFGANAGVCNAQQWAQIAANMVDQENDVATFARIAGWTPANLVNLAGLFDADHGVCNIQEWAQIAVNLADQENNVATFARIAGWTPANLVILAGLFGANAGVCNAQQWAQIAIAHANLINQEAGVAELARMVGWTPANIPIFALNALNNGLTLANLLTFLGTPNAVANCLAVIGWGANVLGTTIGIVLSAAGAPTNAETVQILNLSNVHAWPAVNLQNAARALICGAPNWANVIIHAPTFANNWVAAAGGGMGGAIVVNRDFAGLHFGGGYNVRLGLIQGRINHVKDGHSFERFNMTYANCMRQGAAGNISFYALGTNIDNVLIGHINSAPGQHLADLVAADYPVLGVDPNSFRQNNMGGDRVGIASNGNRIAPPPVGGTYPTQLTQCYPLGGIQIVGRNLVAIGRLMGQI